MIRASLLFLLAALCTSVASGQDPSYLFRPIGHEEFTATLLRAEANTVHFRRDQAEPEQIELDLLAEIGPAEPRALTEGEPHSLWLRSGTVLSATLMGGDEASGRFAVPYQREPFSLPWRVVRGVCLDRASSRDPGFAAALADPPENNDLLFARRPDSLLRVSGEIVGIADDTVRLRVAGAERSLPMDRVYGFVFGDFSGAAPDPQPNPRVRLALIDGGLIPGVLLSVDERSWRLRLDEGVVLTIARDQAAHLRVLSDRLVFLTDLEFEIEQVAALDRVWPPLVDRGPGGGAIVVGGHWFRRGFVLFPHTRMTFAIDGRFDLLEVVVGFEERAGPTANAVFRVLGDDRVLYDSGSVARDAEPASLRIPVTDVQRLSIEADFGEGLDLGDLCAFAGARLVKW